MKRSKKIFCLMVVAAILLILEFPAKADAQSNGVLYFGMRTTAVADYDIYTADPDPFNPNAKKIIGGPGNQTLPVMSPDGRFILYFNNDIDTYVFDLTTGVSQLLLEKMRPLDWHPSGERFLYNNVKHCDEGVYEADVNVTPAGISITSTRLDIIEIKLAESVID